MKTNTVLFNPYDWFDGSLGFVVDAKEIDLGSCMGIGSIWPSVIYNDPYPVEDGQYVYMDTPEGKILLVNSQGMITRIDPFDMESVIRAAFDFGLITKQQMDNKGIWYNFSLYVYCKNRPLIVLDPNE